MAPTRMMMVPGRDSAWLNSGVPQAEQNRRCIWVPLSAKSLVSPVMVTALNRNAAPTVPLPAPSYWQPRHMQ